ncbi:D-alanyl-D-alanine carboxypeptidase family protein [Streptomyces sp. NPDC056519]|uniref:D-alanyl-D-alanine carboxypeptidase family protein n=1 Tax=Streptomyces sp. NPDC056519 TaxID=3345849 RepID=UPI0036A0FE4A
MLLLGAIVLVVQAFRPLPTPVISREGAKTSFTIPGPAPAVPWPAEGQGAVTVVGSGQTQTFGEQKPVPTASVAKVMTAYVILQDHPLKDRKDQGPRIQVDAQAVEEGDLQDETRIEGLKEGQTYSEYDMLKMLMIPSGNNIARLLARWDTRSDSVTAFVGKMNAAAKALDMTHTHYTDPSGLEASTVSTAVDQVNLAEAVMRSDAFRSIVALPSADMAEVGTIYNNNSLLMAKLSVRGIKTGSSTPAGGALSWAAYRTVDGKDQLIIGAMMDQHADGPDPDGADSLKLVLDNSSKVIEAVRDTVTSATVVRKGQPVGYVDDGLGHRTPLVATEDLTAVGLPGTRVALTLSDEGKAPARSAAAGTLVGRLTTGAGPEAQSVPVALQHHLAEPSLLARLTRV